MSQRGKKYLLIPSVPTPNGGLHLGHIGGPYLAADVLARYLRMRGAEALVMSGTDSYESYVTLQAAKEMRPPDSVCHAYHERIVNDLEVMQISMDEFVNPLSLRWNAVYSGWHYRILQQLQDAGSILRVNENMPWDPVRKMYLAGCWLQGKCPQCALEVTGYFCENCGAHFRPEELSHDSGLLHREVTNLFLRLQDICRLSETGIQPEIESSYRQYLNRQQGMLRLTANNPWGLYHDDESTLFNYGFIFAYFLMLGEIASQRLHANENAFSADSSIITIACFGIDNAIPFLASVLGITNACAEFKPFDYYLANHFYLLEGRKFSTSRRHAIWVKDFSGSEKLITDCVRYYLSSINVRENQGDFIMSEFKACCLRMMDCVQRLVIPALQQIADVPITAIGADMMEEMESALARQEQAMRPVRYLPQTATDQVEVWIQSGEGHAKADGNAFWWLKGLCLLVYPMMPHLGQEMWFALGYDGAPDSLELSRLPERRVRPLEMRIVSIQDISLDRWTREVMCHAG
ncbi:Methionine--tRNA ligase [Aquicella siphonis]|uniref:Methionine--tRNA ligase n=1 Tax=Aquicella siphonis TaxID=254247 RepID=A0A5E4PJK8_9COXI|nr:methionine--tRNA ligase [Aquicella siphonis]VVC77220.1 Methionine--tRNA ligase [Aquicella siphonis]